MLGGGGSEGKFETEMHNGHIFPCSSAEAQTNIYYFLSPCALPWNSEKVKVSALTGIFCPSSSFGPAGCSAGKKT
jgi:hypothetical protein